MKKYFYFIFMVLIVINICNSDAPDFELETEISGKTSEESNSSQLKTSNAAESLDLEIENLLRSKPINYSGEVASEQSGTVLLTVPISGKVKSIKVKLGDKIKTGDLIAEIISLELIELKSEAIASEKLYEIAQTNMIRAKKMFEISMIAEKEYLEFKQTLVEAEVKYQAVCQKLLMIGVTSEEIKGLSKLPVEQLSILKVVAPISGEIIESDLQIGQHITEDLSLVTISDLNVICLELRTPLDTIKKILVGDIAKISIKEFNAELKGKVTYINPTTSDSANTILMRVEVENQSMLFKPGMKINGTIDNTINSN